MKNQIATLVLLACAISSGMIYAANPASVNYVNQKIQDLRSELQAQINNINTGGFTKINGTLTVIVTQRASGVVTGLYSIFVIAPNGTVIPGLILSVPLIAANQSFTIGPPIFLGPYVIVVHNISLSASFSPLTNINIQDSFGHVNRFNVFYPVGPGSGGGTLPDYTDDQYEVVPYVTAP